MHCPAESKFCQYGRRLRKKPALHILGDLHFARDAPLGLHAFGDLLGQTNVLVSRAGLGGDGSQQALVVARVGLFRKARAEHQQPFQAAAVAKNGNQALGMKCGVNAEASTPFSPATRNSHGRPRRAKWARDWQVGGNRIQLWRWCSRHGDQLVVIPRR